MVKSSKIILTCNLCQKCYTSKTWFDKHVKNFDNSLKNLEKLSKKNKKICNKLKKNFDKNLLTSPISGDLLPLVFNFDDEFSASKNFVPSNFLDELKLFSKLC